MLRLLQQARRLFTAHGPLWFLAPLAMCDLAFARRGVVPVGMSMLAMTLALDWRCADRLSQRMYY
jgi:hypothetical protein